MTLQIIVRAPGTVTINRGIQCSLYSYSYFAHIALSFTVLTFEGRPQQEMGDRHHPSPQQPPQQPRCRNQQSGHNSPMIPCRKFREVENKNGPSAAGARHSKGSRRRVPALPLIVYCGRWVYIVVTTSAYQQFYSSSDSLKLSPNSRFFSDTLYSSLQCHIYFTPRIPKQPQNPTKWSSPFPPLA